MIPRGAFLHLNPVVSMDVSKTRRLEVSELSHRPSDPSSGGLVSTP